MDERRQYPRYLIKLPIRFQILDSQGADGKNFGKYWTKDVSLGGMRFESLKALNYDTNLAIEIHLPKNTFSEFVTQSPMQVQGRVVWAGENRGQAQAFEIGVEFVALMENEQKRIEECIQFFLNQAG